MNCMVSVGVIGLGSHATDNLIPVILELGDFHLNAISSRSLHNAQQCAARYGASVATDHWRELIDPTIVDAIVVSATPEVHAEVVSLCLERGVHVFVEKPPAPDTDVLRVLAERAGTKPNIVTFVDFNFRYGETYRKVVELVKGEGEIQCVNIRFVSSKPRQPIWGWNSLPRSLLYAVGIHAVDMAVDLLGSAAHVTADACWISKDKLALVLALRCADGKSAFIELGNYSNRFEYRLELLGSSGIVATLEQHNRISIYNAQSISVAPNLFEGKQTIEYVWPSLRGGFKATGYKGAMQSFYESIVSGKPSSSPLSSSLIVYRIMDEVLFLVDSLSQQLDQ